METLKFILIVAIILLTTYNKNGSITTSTLVKKKTILSKKDFFRYVRIQRRINRHTFGENSLTYLMCLMLLAGDIEINPGPVNRYVAKSIYSLFNAVHVIHTHTHTHPPIHTITKLW